MSSNKEAAFEKWSDKTKIEFGRCDSWAEMGFEAAWDLQQAKITKLEAALKAADRLIKAHEDLNEISITSMNSMKASDYPAWNNLVNEKIKAKSEYLKLNHIEDMRDMVRDGPPHPDCKDEALLAAKEALEGQIDFAEKCQANIQQLESENASLKARIEASLNTFGYIAKSLKDGSSPMARIIQVAEMASRGFDMTNPLRETISNKGEQV